MNKQFLIVLLFLTGKAHAAATAQAIYTGAGTLAVGFKFVEPSTMITHTVTDLGQSVTISSSEYCNMRQQGRQIRTAISGGFFRREAFRAMAWREIAVPCQRTGDHTSKIFRNGETLRENISLPISLGQEFTPRAKLAAVTAVVVAGIGLVWQHRALIQEQASKAKERAKVYLGLATPNSKA